jgi:hypothetical protein
MALAHTVGSKVSRAYRRADLLDARRRLMNRWASYCRSTPGEVVPMRRARRAG